MRILLTSAFLCGHSGSELHLRDLARALRDRGHEVRIHALIRGYLAGELEQEGFEVLRTLKDVRTPPNIIHAQHQPALIAALRRFPTVPAIQIIHDATAAIDEPLILSRVSRYAAVDQRCLARLHMAGADEGRCEVMLNFVDLQRFEQRPPLPAVPRRALVFTNYAKTKLENEAIMGACADNNISLDFLGTSTGFSSANPERILPHYDIVFAKARAAIEAMATGCAVILCDFRGLGELVSPERLAELRQWNFGASVLTRPITRDNIHLELARYDAEAAAQVCTEIRAEADLAAAAVRWADLYERTVRGIPDPEMPGEAQMLDRLANRWRWVILTMRMQMRVSNWSRSSGARLVFYNLGRLIWRAFNRVPSG